MNIQERLDRGVANEDWLSICPEAMTQHLPHSFSDHCPLLITTKKKIMSGLKEVSNSKLGGCWRNLLLRRYDTYETIQMET
ncbi:reverse transcriptase [Gossypium australe]|uniref:Reverse transcriptase n=1 Tax=Gossypium australe TaxID=47621 RepID=A0A5B6X076_9ROSI|nr:reverse transcriptase [Gossypium australe]